MLRSNAIEAFSRIFPETIDSYRILCSSKCRNQLCGRQLSQGYDTEPQNRYWRFLMSKDQKEIGLICKDLHMFHVRVSAKYSILSETHCWPLRIYSIMMIHKPKFHEVKFTKQFSSSEEWRLTAYLVETDQKYCKREDNYKWISISYLT